MKAIIAGLPMALSRMSLFEFIFFWVNKQILLSVTKPRDYLVSFVLFCTLMSQLCSRIILKYLIPKLFPNFKMTITEDLEKRIKNLEKEVQHLKAAIQYQTKNKKRRFD